MRSSNCGDSTFREAASVPASASHAILISLHMHLVLISVDLDYRMKGRRVECSNDYECVHSRENHLQITSLNGLSEVTQIPKCISLSI